MGGHKRDETCSGPVRGSPSCSSNAFLSCTSMFILYSKARDSLVTLNEGRDPIFMHTEIAIVTRRSLGTNSIPECSTIFVQSQESFSASFAVEK